MKECELCSASGMMYWNQIKRAYAETVIRRSTADGVDRDDDGDGNGDDDGDDDDVGDENEDGREEGLGMV
ncbi:hypothetical protein Syun_030146 [Stephania yunnanensis]|uniref:Uncharacterized protein n=1 Tax=Stephania yunnanensis TaxID=152371 RepID=A0AAP0EBH6_9MAGN